MLILLFILIVVASLLLWGVILIQNPKGGGLSASFSGATNIIGARQSVDFLEKSTWGLGITIILLVVLSTVMMPSSGTIEERGSAVQMEADEAPTPILPQQGQPAGDGAAPEQP